MVYGSNHMDECRLSDTRSVKVECQFVEKNRLSIVWQDRYGRRHAKVGIDLGSHMEDISGQKGSLYFNEQYNRLERRTDHKASEER